MTFRKFHAVAIAVIASAAFMSQARADVLDLGSSIGPSITITGSTAGTISGVGGDFTPSTLNGNTLPWVFCVDVLNGVNPANSPFIHTAVSHDGTVNGVLVNNAAQIAYVLLNDVIGANPVTNSGEVQAAIWKLEYGGNITSIGDGNPNGISIANGFVTAANAYVAGGGASLIGNLSWLTLTTDDKTQGLVTMVTPEPSTFAIAGLGGLGMLFYARRRRSR
jgi:hypothetical protein